MTVQQFVALFALLTTANGLLTQAMKTFLDNMQIKYSSDIVALIDAIFVGVFGVYLYVYFGNINEPVMTTCVFAILMAVCVWVASMVSYDKVVQMFKQIDDLK